MSNARTPLSELGQYLEESRDLFRVRREFRAVHRFEVARDICRDVVGLQTKASALAHRIKVTLEEVLSDGVVTAAEQHRLCAIKESAHDLAEQTTP